MNVIKEEKVNSNNDWGFGGIIGKYTYYDNGLCLLEGRNYHRHTGTSSANRLSVLSTNDFYIPVRTRVGGKEVTKIPAKGSVISVYKYDGNYYAALIDDETINMYNREYKRIKRIEL